jgi:hypothetical protein
MTKTLADKLFVKNAATLAVLNADARHAHIAAQLPADKIVSSGPAALVLLFVHSPAELDDLLPRALDRLAPQGALWVGYVKGTSRLHAAGVHRDTLRTHAETLGLASVAMIAIDDDWSALRLKRG